MKKTIFAFLLVVATLSFMGGNSVAKENLTQIRTMGSTDSTLILSDDQPRDSLIILMPTFGGRSSGNTYVKGAVQFFAEMDSLGGDPDSVTVWAREMVKNLSGTLKPSWTDSLLLVNNGLIVSNSRPLSHGDTLYVLQIPVGTLYGPCEGFMIHGTYGGGGDSLHVRIGMKVQ